MRKKAAVKDAADGFCMALADSVPGVSGGTVAFILGFYDRFIGSINQLVFGKKDEKLQGMRYLIRLGVGWVLGMGLAVLVLNALFGQNIHFISSLFIGFIIGALPVVCIDEQNAVREWKKGFAFLLAGIFLVVGITILNTQSASAFMNLSVFSPGLALRLFLIGMAAVSAMFLPGISGSTILLIFGAYMPIMHALKELMQFNPASLPAILIFILGIFAGAASVVKMIKVGLSRYRAQMIYFIIGMMAGSLYAIIMGPTTLDIPKEPLNVSNFSIIACVIGVALVIFMQVVKIHGTSQSVPSVQENRE
jgi:putative membrane protein